MIITAILNFCTFLVMGYIFYQILYYKINKKLMGSKEIYKFLRINGLPSKVFIDLLSKKFDRINVIERFNDIWIEYNGIIFAIIYCYKGNIKTIIFNECECHLELCDFLHSLDGVNEYEIISSLVEEIKQK